MNDDLALLAQFGQDTEAELVKTFLESRGVKCMLNDTILNSMWGGALMDSNVRLYVNRPDLSKALELMKEGGFEDYVSEE